jgi:hypothetical protein
MCLEVLMLIKSEVLLCVVMVPSILAESTDNCLLRLQGRRIYLSERILSHPRNTVGLHNVCENLVSQSNQIYI